jgi:mono/diheme cytochrome c family protein
MRTRRLLGVLVVLAALASACGNPNPLLPAPTPIPTLAPGQTLTLIPTLAVAPSSSPSPGGITPAAGVALSALGAPVFMEHCSPCHGDQGQGIRAPALRDNSLVQSAGDQVLFEIISGGVQGTQMPAWLQDNGGPLTAAEINTVIAFLHTLQGVASLPTATPPPAEPTATPLPPGAPTPQPARPSEPGGPGPAASQHGNSGQAKLVFGQTCAFCHGGEGILGVPNPGSDDGRVPPLNPIDPTIANSDPATFSVNLDLFIEHGSVPAGPGPQIMMPAFGDSQMLTTSAIADVIAYCMQLNGVEWPQ